MHQHMQFKASENSHYQFFMADLERVQSEVNRVCKSCMTNICNAENDIGSGKRPEDLTRTSAMLTNDLAMMKHHCSGVKAAAQRFAGIIGIEPPKIKY